MREFIDVSDVPVFPAEERRLRPDPRSSWRGGRRNTDWTNRPIGAWRHLEQGRSPWRHWIAKVPVPTFAVFGQTRP